MEGKYQELIKIASEADREELAILNGAVETTRKAYADQPTAANKKDWDAARGGLDAAVDRMWRQYFPEARRFENLMAVVKHLNDKGYKIKKSKAYQDRKKGRIAIQPDGTVLQKDVDRYAKTLERIADSRDAADTGQQTKLERENSLLETRNALPSCLKPTRWHSSRPIETRYLLR